MINSLYLFITLMMMNVAISDSGIPITILHSNDYHSHFEGSGPDAYFTPGQDNDLVRGHYARIAKVVKEQRKSNIGITLLVDAGDFFSGTLFHLMTPQKNHDFSPELEFFQRLSYDAVAVGNHEFDAQEIGFKTLLRKNKKYQVPLLATNIKNYPNLNEGLNFSSEKPLARSMIKTYRLADKEVRIGYLGIMGIDSIRVSQSVRGNISFWGFNDESQTAQWNNLIQIIEKEALKLKKNNVDLIIGLLHGGAGEEEKIAPFVDVLISGHTHKEYFRVIENTPVAQAGSFGKSLGKLSLLWKNNKLIVKKHEIIAINDKIIPDENMLSFVNETKQKIEKFSLGFKYDEKIFSTTKNWERRPDAKNSLGDLVTKGILEKLNEKVEKKVDFYFTSLALIRGDLFPPYKPTTYQFSDVFKLVGLGFDENQKPGSPVTIFYLQKKEVKNLIDLMELYSKVSINFTPGFSPNLKYKIRWWGIPFLNRVQALTLNGIAYKQWPDLIRVATSFYVAKYFPKAKKMTYSFIDIRPRDSLGRPLKELTPLKLREYSLLSRYLINQDDL